MRAKFGRGPTVVSKKGSLKFISRLINLFLYFNFSDRNGLYAKQTSLFVIVTQDSNSYVHEDMKFTFFIVKVISSVVNMTS